jgi:hypothetical protein
MATGNNTLMVVAYCFAVIMLASTGFVFRNKIKRFIGLADSMNIGEKYYAEHARRLETIKKVKSVFNDFATVNSITDTELTNYENELAKMKEAARLIQDPKEKARQQYHINLVRDKATNLTSTYRRYINALDSIDHARILRMESIAK